jgi:hypothetical protein
MIATAMGAVRLLTTDTSAIAAQLSGHSAARCALLLLSFPHFSPATHRSGVCRRRSAHRMMEAAWASRRSELRVADRRHRPLPRESCLEGERRPAPPSRALNRQQRGNIRPPQSFFVSRRRSARRQPRWHIRAKAYNQSVSHLTVNRIRNKFARLGSGVALRRRRGRVRSLVPDWLRHAIARRDCAIVRR